MKSPVVIPVTDFVILVETVRHILSFIVFQLNIVFTSVLVLAHILHTSFST